jgi:hypothetical protein
VARSNVKIKKMNEVGFIDEFESFQGHAKIAIAEVCMHLVPPKD